MFRSGEFGPAPHLLLLPVAPWYRRGGGSTNRERTQIYLRVHAGLRPSVESFEGFRLPHRSRFRPQQVPDERERIVAVHRPGRNRRGHIDPGRELARERGNELDLLVRKNFADRLKSHIAFSAHQRPPAFALRADRAVVTGEL